MNMLDSFKLRYEISRNRDITGGTRFDDLSRFAESTPEAAEAPELLEIDND